MTGLMDGLIDRVTGERARRQAAADAKGRAELEAVEARRSAEAQETARRLGVGGLRAQEPEQIIESAPTSAGPVMREGSGQRSLDRRMREAGLNKGTARVPGPNVDKDVVSAKLTPGEAVLNKGAAELLGRENIEALNAAGNEGHKTTLRDGVLHAAGGVSMTGEDANEFIRKNKGGYPYPESVAGRTRAITATGDNVFDPQKVASSVEPVTNSVKNLNTTKVGNLAIDDAKAAWNDGSPLQAGLHLVKGTLAQVPALGHDIYNGYRGVTDPPYKAVNEVFGNGSVGKPTQSPSVTKTLTAGDVYDQYLKQATPDEQKAFYDNIAELNGGAAQRSKGLAEHAFMNGGFRTAGTATGQMGNFNERSVAKHGDVAGLESLGNGVAKVTLRDGHKVYTNVGTQGFAGQTKGDGWENTPEYKAAQERLQGFKKSNAAFLATYGDGPARDKAKLDLAIMDRDEEHGLRRDQIKSADAYRDAQLGIHRDQVNASIENNRLLRSAQALQAKDAADKAAATDWDKLVKDTGYDEKEQASFDDFVRRYYTLKSKDPKDKSKTFTEMSLDERRAAIPEMKQQYNIMKNTNEYMTHGRTSSGPLTPVAVGDMTYADVNNRSTVGDIDVGPRLGSKKDRVGLGELISSKMPWNDASQMVVLRNARGEIVRMRKADWLKAGGAPGDLKASLDGLPTIEQYEKENNVKR